ISMLHVDPNPKQSGSPPVNEGGRWVRVRVDLPGYESASRSCWTMWDFSVTRALGLMFKTSPFVLLRMAVYFGAGLAYVVVTGAGAGIGWGIGGFGDAAFQAGTTIWGGVIGFGLVGVVMYLAREYVLYIVKAGHIAVLVKLLDGEQMPEGRSQVA